ncbi:MAG: hypothetical protein EPO28_11735 [Saprospiraceae bacterium]|nr:MAG: hypothetical protein EPO28_11735 [Saprospiraceae bacterium]
MKNTALKSSVHLKGVRYPSAFTPSKVWLDNKYLNPARSLKVKNHSVGGFNWGDDEKGAAQLALAICIELYPLEVAKEIYQEFKTQFIQSLQGDTLDTTLSLTSFNAAFAEPWLTEP